MSEFRNRFRSGDHVAEHVEDPAQLCRELSRVAHAGYLETPGWLGDVLMREPFHRWRVRRRGRRLIFSEVVHHQPLGRLGEWVYALCYIGEARPGHRSITSSRPLLRGLFRVARQAFARLWRSPLLRDRVYLCHEWEGSIEVEVRRAAQRAMPTGSQSTEEDRPMDPEGGSEQAEERLPGKHRSARPGRLADDEQSEGKFRRQPADADDLQDEPPPSDL